jgi:hypothetical protein
MNVTPGGSGRVASATCQPSLVRPGCWSVGRRNPESLLQCNTYLRSFRGASATHICIDPGSRLDYATLEANLTSGWISCMGSR